MSEIAAMRVRVGYRGIHILLMREGWPVHHKRVQRLYRKEGVSLRVKCLWRDVTAARRVERRGTALGNDIRSMDFTSEVVFDGRWFRAVTVFDACTWECPAIEVDHDF